jgi:hypothetical protein
MRAEGPEGRRYGIEILDARWGLPVNDMRVRKLCEVKQWSPPLLAAGLRDNSQFLP